MELTKVDFINNEAKNIGGGIIARLSNMTIEECKFIGNICENFGGAIFLEFNTTGILNNNQ